MNVKEKEQEFALHVVNPEMPVSLTITIGNAQIGASQLQWAGEEPFAKGAITKLPLGRGGDISGKVLDAMTNILDTNIQSNKVIATYVFTNCEPDILVLSDAVDNNGDVFSFLSHILFT